MIDVAMRNDDAQQARMRIDKPIDRRQKRLVEIVGVEWLSKIEQDAKSIAVKLDAGATDLLSATMDTSAKRHC